MSTSIEGRQDIASQFNKVLKCLISKNLFLVMLAAQLSGLKHGYTYTSPYRLKSKSVWS